MNNFKLNCVLLISFFNYWIYCQIRFSNFNHDRLLNYDQFKKNIYNIIFQLDSALANQCHENVNAQWNYEISPNDVTLFESLSAQKKFSELQYNIWNKIYKEKLNNIDDENLKRQMRLLSNVETSALPSNQLDHYNRLINDMISLMNRATICSYDNYLDCSIKLQPDLVKKMAFSRNWDELEYYWIQWRSSTGEKIKDVYEQMVKMSNIAANLNNFTNIGELWLSYFDSENIESEFIFVWNEVKPLYEELHAYVRRKLRDYYGVEKMNKKAPIPAHILGDLWAQSWSNIADITLPYPGRNFLNLSTRINHSGYTPLTFFQIAEDFFQSMNMSRLPDSFWRNSIFEKVNDDSIICHTSAWDFCNSRDFRIKMCAEMTIRDLITVHHELSHIHYFLNYKNLPKIFRDGACPGMHEALGEVIALSVRNLNYFQKFKLFDGVFNDDYFTEINNLFMIALEKVPFMSFALVMDSWRWDVFQNTITRDQYNCHWWRLRESISGIKPPVLRSEKDFDPGSKYHIIANIPYIRHFVGIVLQFQIYRALCIASNEYNPNDLNKPLHKCNLYNKKQAGFLLRKIMEQGSSKSWKKVLKDTIGEDQLDGSAIVEYFKPLLKWLHNENIRTEEFVGWIYDGDYCRKSLETVGLEIYGGFSNSGLTLSFFNFIHFIVLFYFGKYVIHILLLQQ